VRGLVDAGEFDHVLRDVLNWHACASTNTVQGSTYSFDCVRSSGPSYFRDVGIMVADIFTRSNFLSAQRGDMVMPLGRWSFHVAACSITRLKCPF